MKKHSAWPFLTVMAVSLAVGSWSCTGGEGGDVTGGGEGGSGEGGSGAGGATTKGGATGSGGATAKGGAPGSGGAAGGSGGSDAGAKADTAPDTTVAMSDTAVPDTSPDTGAAGGPFMIKGDFLAMGTYNCHKKEQTSSGGQRSPELMWGTAPEGTMSLAVSLKDRNGGTHWVMCNIPPTTTGLPRDINNSPKPMGAVMSNSWYGPGAGSVNTYEYRVWALKVASLPACGKGVYPNTLMMNAIEYKEVLARGNSQGACTPP